MRGGYLMPKKGENIYKRKDGRWEGRYIKSRDRSGKINYGYVYAKTYRDAKRKLHEVPLHSTLSMANFSKKPETFSELASEWFDCVKPHLKESTQNKYQNLLESYILPMYATKHLEDITYDFISEQCNLLLLIGGRKGTGLSSKTVADVLSLIRSILKFAIQKGKAVSCDGSNIHIKQASKPMRILSKAEQEKLCQYLYTDSDPRNLGIFICIFTGLRIGEVCALRWEDISFSEQTLCVHNTLQRVQDKSTCGKKTKIVITTPKSLCSIRTIPIPNTLLSILTTHGVYSSGYVLTNSETVIEPRSMQNKFKQILKNSGIAPANFHALRHTFATRCIELGFDVKSLSEILGHASVNITMNRYVHPSFELKKENMKKLDSLLAVK